MLIDKFNRQVFKVDLPKKQYLKYDGKHFYCGDNKINVVLNKNLLRINYNHTYSLEHNGKLYRPPRIAFFTLADDPAQHLVTK